MTASDIRGKEGSKSLLISKRMKLERIIFYIDILLLTFAIGINVQNMYVRFNSPPTYTECGE